MSTFKYYIQLMRLHKPIGLFLLLWPTYWALWLAGQGTPSVKIIFLFTAGVILMRSAGCVINDIADRRFDPFVSRTKERPLASSKVSLRGAWGLFFGLLFSAFGIVLCLNELTIKFAFLAAFFAMLYPFLKRWTHWPQIGLGIAFSLSVPMSFAAISNEVPYAAWVLFLASVIWPIMYDTQYAMVDCEEDKRIGVKSTAILFEGQELFWIALLQLVFLSVLSGIGLLFHLSIGFYISLMGAAFFFLYQLSLIKTRERDACFKAFLNNQWVGLIIFLGIWVSG